MAQLINHFTKVQPTVAGKWSTKAVWEKVAQIKRAIRDSYFRAVGRQKADGPAEEASVQSRAYEIVTKTPIIKYRISLQGYKSTVAGYAWAIQQQMATRGALHNGKSGPFGRDFLWRRVRRGHLVGFATLFLMHEENHNEQELMKKRWELYDKLCENIKVTFSHDHTNTKDQLIFPGSGYDLSEFRLGECIAVGSNGAVVEAELINSKTTSNENTQLKDSYNSRAPRPSGGKYGMKNKVRNIKKRQRVTTKKAQKLAIKMIFNFDSSNAGAIHRLTRAELVTCGRGAISGLSRDWQNGTRARMKRLPSHPNIIEVHRALIGKVPEHPEFVQSFPAALPHPTGFGRSLTMFLVMKRYECTLEEYLRGADLPSSVRHLLALQLLQGVAHLERNNVAHRDLKANNIFIEEDSAGLPRLVIGDFGCSFVPAEGEDLVFPFLSPNYDIRNGNGDLQAPEIKHSKPGPASVLDYRKADAWAVGILLQEIMGHNTEATRGNNCVGANLRNELVKNITDLLMLDSPEKRMSCQCAAGILHLELFGPKFDNMKVYVEDVISNWLLLHASETMAYKSTRWGQDSVIRDLFSGFLSVVAADDLTLTASTWQSLIPQPLL